MIKQLSIALSVAAAAMFANAGTLYWQINDNREFSLAKLWVTGGSKAIDTVLAEGVGGETTFVGTTTGPVQTDITGYEGDGYSYLVELLTYGSDGVTVENDRWLNAYSYNDLVSQGYISTGSVGVPGVGASGGAINMNAGGYYIPEPTSGLLMLFGGALMALRRRRRA